LTDQGTAARVDSNYYYYQKNIDHQALGEAGKEKEGWN
jgi:hypothetical protein